MKKIKLENEDEGKHDFFKIYDCLGVPSTAMREISILKELKHPNIVDLKEIVFQPEQKKLYLIFEYVEYDLKKWVRKNKRNITKKKIQKMIYQMLRGVDYCHSRRIIHRDLKPQNILVD